MTSSDKIHARLGYKWIVTLLFAFAISLLNSTEARADDRCIVDHQGLIDGLVTPNPPAQLQIDGNCIIRNFPASHPFTSNISWYGNNPTSWLLIFDNVVFTGNMSCNLNSQGNRIWFVNGSSSSLKDSCLNLLIPVEKISKLNPAGQTTASIGVPFTYKLIIPTLFDPATGTVTNANGSPNDLHGITIWDDLNATGVDLNFVSERAYWVNNGTPIPHTFSNVGGLLTFDNFPVVPAGQQFVIEITVVLRNTPTNAPGKTFVNTAKWDFGRLINGTYFEPLPGEWGISPPLTIVAPTAPALVLTKSGPPTMNLGQWGNFAIDIRNTGTGDAWNASIRDVLPDGATGGMCDQTPDILSAQVFAADGVTPVTGKGPLTAGSGYSLNYSAAPNCRLDIVILTAAGRIGPNERLIIRYRTQLDGNTQNGVALTNVAGSIQWFNGDSSNPNRVSSTRTLTNGTPGVADHEDAFTVTVALSGVYFEKTVADLTSGANPAKTAAPGDKLRYTLRFRTTNQPFNNFRIFDELDAMNAQPAFVPGTLTLVTVPPGADTSATSSTGGTKGTGLLHVRNLNLPADSELQIQFDITLASTLSNGTVVSNQSTLGPIETINFPYVVPVPGTTNLLSDDPTVNGTASPTVVGDEDPTRLTIGATPATFRVQKISTDMTGDPNVLLAGETLRYTITVKNIGGTDATNVVLRDAVPANTAYVAGSTTMNGAPVPDVAGLSPLVNGMRINSPANTMPGLMPADASSNQANVATITFNVVVNPSAASGTVISNQGFVSADNGIVNRPSDDPDTPTPDDPTIDIVSGLGAPALVLTKSGPATMNLGQRGDFTINVQNTGPTGAWNTTIRDLLPRGATGGMCDLTPAITGVQVFAADGVTPVSGKGPLNSGSGYSLSYSAAPNCRLEITLLTAAGTIGPNERLIIHYQTQLDANTQNGVTLTNIAGAIQWFNGDSSNSNRQSYTRTLTNGTVGTPDHEDAHTVTVGLTTYIFEKTAENRTRNVYPAMTAAPGDTLRYTLRVRATDPALTNFRIFDDLGTLNPGAAFVPGTLTLVTYPTGADISNTSSTAGTRGMGVIDIRNLNLPTTGDLVIQFDVKLETTLTVGTVISNQSTLRLATGTVFASSDDPNVNGAASPQVSGDEDPTRVTIVAPAPKFLVQKISTDLTGDPDLLLAGETLRYTITVKNIGDADAMNVVLRDLVPTNTIYVAGSTRLNGVAVPDSGGLPQLVNGMQINSVANATPGSMPADASSNSANVATINFDVVVNPNVVTGTVISNQGFVSAAGGIADIPSDDPDTPTLNDPTRDIVGGRPLLYAEKRVALFVDNGSPGIVDPGDVLRYTITVQNNSTQLPSTGVVLRDSVPANTTYVANSTLHNGQPVGQPDGGISPLAAGINISSGFGIIAPGAKAVVQYDLRVNAGTPAGTIISNQGVVTSVELPALLTDGDGNPATGPEPTVVVVGAGQQLSIAKQVAVVGGGAAIPGAQLEYVVQVMNIGAVPALNVVITDDLNAQPGLLAYVNGSATMNGATAGVTFAGSTITANYAAVSGPLQPGGVVVLRFRATLAAGLMVNTVVTNTGVVTWNQPPQTASASVSFFVGGVPGFSVLNGSAWHDADFDDVQDTNERPLDGWTVDLYRDGLLYHSVQTDAAGVFRIIGVEPNNISGNAYELRFRAPGAGANTAMLGLAVSPFTNSMHRIANIVVFPGTNLVGLNLPIDPNGVVYDSVTRTPVAGATLTMRNFASTSPLPASCFADAAQQGQVTLANGYYKFDMNFSDPACASDGTYVISVTTLGTNYLSGNSQIIPPASDASNGAFSVPLCPASINDAIPSTALFCEVQASEFQPDTSVAPRSTGTVYYTHVRLDGSRMPGTSQIFNNHIALDPITPTLTISKTTPMLNVTRGQLVPYVITVNNSAGVTVTDVSIVDRMPAGFTYVKGSALLDGVAAEPSVAGLELRWNRVAMAGTEARTVRLLLAVGAGVSEGEFVNRAQALNGASSAAMSGEATARVRVIPDPTFDCTDVIGKVFNDANRNGLQDDGEEGLSGVRVVTARGLAATTDQYGRYHITCAITPHESRGSNFVLKLDDRTLPSGFRMSTDQILIKSATRGQTLRLNFGASIFRVVGIDLSDAVFEPGTTDIRVQWRSRVNLLLEELRKAPAVLRLSYVADTEDASLVERRVEAIKRQLTEAWNAANDSHALAIEREVFWRRGAPPKRPDVRVPGSK